MAGVVGLIRTLVETTHLFFCLLHPRNRAIQGPNFCLVHSCRTRNERRSALPGSRGQDCRSCHCSCKRLCNKKAKWRSCGTVFYLDHVGHLHHLSTTTPTAVVLSSMSILEAAAIRCHVHACFVTPFRQQLNRQKLLPRFDRMDAGNHQLVCKTVKPSF